MPWFGLSGVWPIMDKIILTGLNFHGFHGVLKEEQVLGQLFIIDLELNGNFSLACQSDEVNNALNYSEAYEAVKEIVEGQRFNLIEALAEKIAQTLLDKFSLLLRILVRVNKPHAPIKGLFDNVAVEITRDRPA